MGVSPANRSLVDAPPGENTTLEHVPIRWDTPHQPLGVIPAKAGIHRLGRRWNWLNAPAAVDYGFRLSPE